MIRYKKMQVKAGFSVTRSDDLLDFEQLFKAFRNK